MQQELPITERTHVKRHKERARYEKTAIYNVIEQAFFGTIAFNDGENTHAIPTAIWREIDHLYIHGSNGSRLLKCLKAGIQACVSITNIHGLVLARTAFTHSMNYSSVCIYGSFETVAEENKNIHMQRFLEHWLPERWQHVRPPNQKELAATTILRISLNEAVMKSRQGPPVDDVADMDQPVWAGVVPLSLQWQAPEQAVEQNDIRLPGQMLKLL